MNNELDKYKEFVDDVVSLKEAVASEWVLIGSYPMPAIINVEMVFYFSGGTSTKRDRENDSRS